MNERKHAWVSNKAFTTITGIKRVCTACRQTNLTAAKVCPGPPAERVE